MMTGVSDVTQMADLDDVAGLVRTGDVAVIGTGGFREHREMRCPLGHQAGPFSVAYLLSS